MLRASRSSVYYQPVMTPEREYGLLEAIDKIHTDKPFLGSRRVVDELAELELLANRKCVQRLMRVMGIEAIYPRPRASRPGSEAGSGVPVPPRGRGLCAAESGVGGGRDVHSDAGGLCVYGRDHGRVQPQGLGVVALNTLLTRYCVEALWRALALQGPPEIFNSKQGARFTSSAFWGVLERRA